MIGSIYTISLSSKFIHWTHPPLKIFGLNPRLMTLPLNSSHWKNISTLTPELLLKIHSTYYTFPKFILSATNKNHYPFLLTHNALMNNTSKSYIHTKPPKLPYPILYMALIILLSKTNTYYHTTLSHASNSDNLLTLLSPPLYPYKIIKLSFLSSLIAIIGYIIYHPLISSSTNCIYI